MDRGDVYRSNIYLPDRSGGPDRTTDLLKWCVVLQAPVGSFASVSDVAVVIASTDHSGGRRMRPFELRVGQTEGFQHDSVIDCRWVFTFAKSIFQPADLKTHLDAALMRRVSAAIVAGLQL